MVFCCSSHGTVTKDRMWRNYEKVPGEHRIRDLNDEINKDLREKGYWEDQLLAALPGAVECCFGQNYILKKRDSNYFNMFKLNNLKFLKKVCVFHFCPLGFGQIMLRIKKLGGADYKSAPRGDVETYGAELAAHSGYKYFGAAKEGKHNRNNPRRESF